MAAPTRRLAPDDLLPTIASMLATETDLIANMANIAALIYEALPDLNWAGFYLWKDGQLVLGPFQGGWPARASHPAGVCGTAARDRVTQVVPDVHDFPGHIACDAASASEIVVPVLAGDRLLGVLDVDSPRRDRFTHADQAMLEAVVALLVRSLPHK
ncbi:GAF domain-containing protein [Komagataeibacter rhaeticus]|nr:GAF domain-containing protein [Komagataeibacter rhaeticus]